MRQAVLANTAALIGGLFVISPALSPLMAQAAPASSCAVDQNKPKELAIAYLTSTRLNSQPAGPARDPLLKTLIKDLMDKPEKFASNPGGYNYVLSSVLSSAAAQPDGLTAKTRGAMGLTTRPNDQFDVIAELDSAYTRWAAAAPSCATDASNARNGDAWLAITNKAFSFIQTNPDSAVYFAKKSIQLTPTHPFAHYILAQVATTKNDLAAAQPEWQTVVKLAGADTLYKDIKQSALFYMGTADLQAAAKATGDAQKTLAKSAADNFKQHLAMAPAGPDAPNVMNNLAESLKLSGDVAGIKAIYADMIANPTKYNEMTLATAGVIASATANDNAGAAKLFAGMVQVNPMSRDGLRNLAPTLYTEKQYAEVLPIARRLVEIDPNNYDGWNFAAFAAAELEKPLKAGPEKKAWGDTIVKYNGIAEGLKARVEVVGFSRSTDGAEVTLQIEQAGATAGTYSVVMEFLDKSGAVVTTATEPVGPINKSEKKNVTLKGKGAGIVAFRYKSLG